MGVGLGVGPGGGGGVGAPHWQTGVVFAHDQQTVPSGDPGGRGTPIQLSCGAGIQAERSSAISMVKLVVQGCAAVVAQQVPGGQPKGYSVKLCARPCSPLYCFWLTQRHQPSSCSAHP